jgi:uncharacterized lipoprotein YajG
MEIRAMQVEYAQNRAMTKSLLILVVLIVFLTGCALNTTA